MDEHDDDDDDAASSSSNCMDLLMGAVCDVSVDDFCGGHAGDGVTSVDDGATEEEDDSCGLFSVLVALGLEVSCLVALVVVVAAVDKVCFLLRRLDCLRGCCCCRGSTSDEDDFDLRLDLVSFLLEALRVLSLLLLLW